MKIERLHVQGFKLLRNLILDFQQPDGPRPFTVLVGRNATGKTSVLKAIALAAAGRDGAMQIGADTAVSFFDRREDAPESVTVKAMFNLPPAPRFGRRQPRWTRTFPAVSAGDSRMIDGIKTELLITRPADPSFSGGSMYRCGEMTRIFEQSPIASFGPVNEAHARGQAGWFVVGYSVTRQLRVRGASALAERPPRVREKLGNLFTDATPVGLGYLDEAAYEIAKPLMKLLKKAVAGDERLVPMIKSLESGGRGGIRNAEQLAERDKVDFDGTKLPATYLSHGYQATLAWLADLIGQFLLDVPEDKRGKIELQDLSGLVLVDELDLFLHPGWQAGFVDALTTTFPNLQFVATTHSPLLLAGCAPEQVIILESDEDGSVRARHLDRDPRLMTATDLYTEVFGIADPPPGDLARSFARYQYLARDADRDDGEETELQDLSARLVSEGVKGLRLPKDRR